MALLRRKHRPIAIDPSKRRDGCFKQLVMGRPTSMFMGFPARHGGLQNMVGLCHGKYPMNIWMVLMEHHPFLDEFFPYNHPFWGYLHCNIFLEKNMEWRFKNLGNRYSRVYREIQECCFPKSLMNIGTTISPLASSNCRLQCAMPTRWIYST